MGASFKKGAQIYDEQESVNGSGGINNDEVRSESSGHSGKTGLTGASVFSGKTGHSFSSKGSSFSRKNFRKKKKNNDETNYRDPPMPFMGKLVAYSIMTDRFAKARKASSAMFEAVQRDCADAVCEARLIPVTKETDRILISQDVQDRIALRRCKKDIRYYISGNRLEIQKHLLIRKHGLDMMNHNYSNEVVRHLEPVDTEGARNTTIYANNGETDPVAEGAMTLMDTRSVASGSVAGGSRAGSVMNSHMASPNKRR